MAKSKAEGGRFPSRKMGVVLRVLGGDDLDLNNTLSGCYRKFCPESINRSHSSH